LGGLTTFSTFSAEVIVLLDQGAYFWAGLCIGMHLIGSLAMTLLGVYAVRSLIWSS
jgi:CrcB protein